MEESQASSRKRSKRGPYRDYLSQPWKNIPRTTRFNWRKNERDCVASACQKEMVGEMETQCQHMSASELNECTLSADCCPPADDKLPTPEEQLSYSKPLANESDCDRSVSFDPVSDTELPDENTDETDRSDEEPPQIYLDDVSPSKCDDTVEKEVYRGDVYFGDNDLECLMSNLGLGKDWWEDNREATESYADDDPHEESDDDDDLDLHVNSNQLGNTNSKTSSDVENSDPLYPGAPITVAVSMLLIITFAVRHGLSGVALADLLTLIQLHCITPNLCKKSVKCLKQFFMTLEDPLEFHYYCPQCKDYIGKQINDIHLCKTCSTETRKNKRTYFILIPIAEQLQKLFMGK